MTYEYSQSDHSQAFNKLLQTHSAPYHTVISFKEFTASSASVKVYECDLLLRAQSRCKG